MARSRRQLRADVANERGQAAMEFALVLPVVLILIMAIVNFGITWNHYVTLSDAVRAGVRQAVVCRFAQPGAKSPDQTVRDAAIDLPNAQNPGVLGVDVLAGGSPEPWPCPSQQPGTNVTVSGSYPYSIDVMGIVVKSGNLNSTITQQAE